MKLSSLQSVTFLPIFRVRVHLCDEKCCTSFPGKVLLEERRQPSRLSRHWNALVSPLFSIFAHTHAWGISRKEGWCARRHFPSLGPWPSHHIYTRRTSPTAPTRYWTGRMASYLFIFNWRLWSMAYKNLRFHLFPFFSPCSSYLGVQFSNTSNLLPSP